MSMFADDIMAEIAAAPTAGHAIGLFWVEVLKDPRFDAGSDSPQMMLAETMAAMTARPKIDKDQRKTFVDEVAAFVNVAESSYMSRAGVDYEPDWTLSKAAIAAEIDMARKPWPWKTSTWRDDDGNAVVSYGYGALPVTIWTPKSDNREEVAV